MIFQDFYEGSLSQKDITSQAVISFSRDYAAGYIWDLIPAMNGLNINLLLSRWTSFQIIDAFAPFPGESSAQTKGMAPWAFRLTSSLWQVPWTTPGFTPKGPRHHPSSSEAEFLQQIVYSISVRLLWQISFSYNEGSGTRLSGKWQVRSAQQIWYCT